MDKLTLEHLAPYLPYGLKVQYNWESKITKVLEDRIGVFLGVRNRIQKFDILVNDFSNDPEWYNILKIKPILRPLSDLTKEISGKLRYNVIIEVIVNDTDTYCDVYNEWLESFIDNPEQSRIIQAPYEVFQELVKRHFDVFGLIDSGLAIDINTLKGDLTNA